MFLKKISLLNYKNLEQVELELSQGINCFIGNNGAGKTNLLDGVYYLCFCKSCFSEADTQNVRHGENFMMLQGIFSRKGADEHIYCGLKKGQKKQFQKNKIAYKRLAEHIGFLPLVMVSPADMSLIIGGSEERRKFIDSVIAQYDKIYLEHLIRYFKILAQRNRLLKNFNERSSDQAELIEVFNQQMVPLAAYIFKVRKEFCEQLIPIFQSFYSLISENNEKVGLAYQSLLDNYTMEDLLARAWQKDKLLQHTTVGIHRDDLIFKINDYPMKKEGSQGQKKTYLVALKFAQYEFLKNLCGFNPILLLDDIFDKLDVKRVEQIIKILSDDNFGQIFISDTNKDNIELFLQKTSSDYRIFKMEKGQILDNEKK